MTTTPTAPHATTALDPLRVVDLPRDRKFSVGLLRFAKLPELQDFASLVIEPVLSAASGGDATKAVVNALSDPLVLSSATKLADGSIDPPLENVPDLTFAEGLAVLAEFVRHNVEHAGEVLGPLAGRLGAAMPRPAAAGDDVANAGTAAAGTGSTT